MSSWGIFRREYIPRGYILGDIRFYGVLKYSGVCLFSSGQEIARQMLAVKELGEERRTQMIVTTRK